MSTSSVDVPNPDEKYWEHIDTSIRRSWDSKLRSAAEGEVRAAPQKPGRLFLPFPFVIAFDIDGPLSVGHSMFAWDTYFVDCALIRHDRLDLVYNHIRNYLFMIDRYGYMPNMNSGAGVTRSQTPVFPDGIWRYYIASQDRELLFQAYPLLKREYRDYWNAPHHQTAIGLATNRDLGDQSFSAQMAAEAETGLDWTPIYNGDVRRCVPLITNCALVRFAHVLSMMASELGLAVESADFAAEATIRAELIRKYCWNNESGLFLEYDYVSNEQLPYVSGCAYWPLWAGVATARQARRLVSNISQLEHRYGLALTDRAYPDPHPAPSYGELILGVPADAIGGLGQLQWMYPAGWACMQLITAEGLDIYGYPKVSKRISARFLAAMTRQHEKTGRLWEKYNVVDGTLDLPNSRYGNSPYVSWTAAAAVLLGRRVFLDETCVLDSMQAAL